MNVVFSLASTSRREGREDGKRDVGLGVNRKGCLVGLNSCSRKQTLPQGARSH